MGLLRSGFQFLVRELSEERVKDELAYFKARLTDIDRAPPHSKHRQGRARIVRKIQEYQAVLKELERQHGKPDGHRRRSPPPRPRMMSH